MAEDDPSGGPRARVVRRAPSTPLGWQLVGPARPASALRALLLLALAAWLHPARASDATDELPSLQGYSGLLDTPSAWVHAPGSAHLLLTNEEDRRFHALDPSTGEPWPTRTFVISSGFLPYTEGHLRVTDVSPSGGAVFRLRDLSFGAKLQLPLDLLWSGLPFALAIGTADEGGSSTSSYFRSRYAVASARWWRLSGSVGYGTGPDRLEGVFGGIEARALEWVHLVVDNDARDWSGGVRFAISVSLAQVPIQLGLVAKKRLSRDSGRPALAASLAVPLDFGKRTARGAGKMGGAPPAEESAPQVEESAPPAGGSTTSAEGPDGTLAQLRALEDDLVRIGFESVRVGADGTTLVVEYENEVYNHSEADGLGVVLAAIGARRLEGFTRFSVNLHRSRIALAELSGRIDAGGQPVTSSLAFGWRAPHRAVAWASEKVRNSSLFHFRGVIAPGLLYDVATEVGLFDYVFSMRPEVQVGIWPGANAYAVWDIPVLWSANFDAGRAFANDRRDPRLDYALLQQVVPLAPGLTAMVGGGAYATDSLGGLGEVLWAPGSGHHALGVQGAYMRESSGVEHRSVTGSYRVHVPWLDLVGVVRGGQFFFEDRGFRAELSRFFGDTSIGVFYADTGRRILGIQMSVPLGPRRDMRPGLVQVRGARRWRVELNTVVGERTNPLPGPIAIPPLSPWNLDDIWLDAGRLDAGVQRALPEASWGREQLSR